MHQFLQDTIPMARYRFTFRALEPVMFANQQGSLLRGAMGHALKSVACMTDADRCQGCPLDTNCPYPVLFEPRRPVALAGFADAKHPTG